MKILGIETSCDETAMSVLEIGENHPPSLKLRMDHSQRVNILSNIVSSQVKLHAKFGGVVPNLAAREHAKNIGHVFDMALKEANINDFEKEITLIAVTRGPGLGPALLVGITFAKTLAWIYQKPLIGVNHLRGHVYSNWLPSINQNLNLKSQKSEIFPILNLIVSGGHTELVLMTNHKEFKIIGETLDDAIGEAFDKVARLLDLGYPGGPIISKFAADGDSSAYPLPSPMIHSKNYNFSYSGLKTAVLYLIKNLKEKNIIIDDKVKSDIAASFQKSAIDVLIPKTIRAAKEFKVKTIMLSGGVSANKSLREELKKEAEKNGLNYSQPEMQFTTDNAVMIAAAGYFEFKNNKSKHLWSQVQMDANLSF